MQKVFKLNKKNKIEFTKEELKTLLDEVYEQGYQEGKNQNWSWYSPWLGGQIYTTTTASNQIPEDYHLDTTTTTSKCDIHNYCGL